MFFGLLVSIILQFIVFVSCSIDYSYFKSTRVLMDTCSRTTAFSVFDSKNAIFCALKCFKNVNCRRFMIRKQPNGVECSFYYEGENCATIQTVGCSCFMKTFSKVNNGAICPIGLYGNNCENIIKDCSEGHSRGWAVFDKWVRSYIKPLGMSGAFEVTCEFLHGGYTLIMSRDKACQDLSFNRNMAEYVYGFGDADGDHWLGLTRMKKILNNHPKNRLSVVFFGTNYCENVYSNFSIGTIAERYTITLGDYDTGAFHRCGDSLRGAVDIEGSPFSAPGSDQTSFNCANNRQGGWWYADETGCSESYFMGSKVAMLWPTSRGSAPQNFVGLRIKPY